MVKRTDSRPRHQQIAAELRAAIMAGDLQVGEKIPSTRELESQFEVTNKTVQDAVQVLKDEGILVGRRGQGVFVRSRKPLAFGVSAYKAPDPGGYKYEILGVAEVQPPGEVAEAFGMGADGLTVLRHRLTLYDGVPVELDRSYYPVDIARGTALALSRKIKGGAPRVLAEAGYPQRDFVDRVSVRPPTTEELLLLEMPESVHLLCQLRTVYSDNGRPVEVSMLAMPGHLYELSYRQTIS